MPRTADCFLLQVESLLATGHPQEEAQSPRVHTNNAHQQTMHLPSPWSADLPQAGLPASPSGTPMCIPPLWSHVAASLAPAGKGAPQEAPTLPHFQAGIQGASLPIASLHCGEGGDAKAASLQSLLVTLRTQGMP